MLPLLAKTRLDSTSNASPARSALGLARLHSVHAEAAMTATDFVSVLTSRELSPRKAGNGWESRCPGHEDRNASLSVSTGHDGKILLHCHAGCAVEIILGAIGLKKADLFPPKASNGKLARKPVIVATYDYTDEAGALLFQCVRFDPKDFRQRRPDPQNFGKWIWNLKGVRRVVYQLPEVISALKDGRTIFVLEGEKDCDALVNAGFAATCNPMGAAKWLPEHADTLSGAACVVIIADKDAPGRKHARVVAQSLHGVARQVKLLELPDRNGKPVKDAFDWLAVGGTADELRAIVSSAPEFTPAAEPERYKPGSVASEMLGSSEDGPAETPDESNLTAWIRGQIVKVLRGDSPQQAKRYLIASKVADALEKLGRFYFHADWRDFDSAMFFDAQRKRLERVRADAFGAWLSEWLNVNRADSLFKFITAAVETAALSGAQTTGILPESFWASRPDAIYLSNGDGNVVKISASGVQLTDNGTDGVLFPVGRTLAPWELTKPRDPFETCSLFRNAHCSASHGQDLLRLYFYSLPTNPRSKPPLCLVGEVGSGKTRLAKGFAELYGLPFVAAKVEDEAESNFWPAIDQGGIYTLDNADSKCRWLADALANASTDGCSQRRKLYTNAETVVLRARAWLCVTTCNPTFASDAGLADRLLVVRMERHGDETGDAILSDEIAAARDGALSHVATTLQKALADSTPTPASLNQRHPDFAAFAVKIGRALGREAKAIAALKAAEADKSAFCLENDSVGCALLAYLRESREFSGTAAELLPRLQAIDPELSLSAKPLSAKRLGKRISMLWPHLTKSLGFARRDKDRNGIAIFTLRHAGFAGFEEVISIKPLREE